MAVHRIKKGLNLPITGAPSQEIGSGNAVTSVAVLGADFVGMKPRLTVKVGERVQKGQLLFSDRKNDGVLFTAPGAGEITAIHRGAKRKFLSLVIKLDGTGEHVTFAHHTGEPASAMTADAVRALMIESGAWTTLRARPFNRVPAADSKPESIFVNGMDTEPLSGDVDLIFGDHAAAFTEGLNALHKLSDGAVFLCVGEGSKITDGGISGVKTETFTGPHPAGLTGTHMHTLKPAGRKNVQWSIGLQDTIALGYLFQTGKLFTDRVVAISGPKASNPRLVKTRLGASLTDLLAGESAGDDVRTISGSVLSGRTAEGDEHAWLGARHAQVSLIREDKDRHFMGWLKPGANAFSTKSIFLSALMPGKKFALTSNQHGQARAMVPIGMYEKVMPLDILPTFLLRALITGDTEQAEQLGALELDEEDLALCTFVCPGKYEYGPILSERLAQIHKEG
ncbi:MAG: Na(+)-translocating NADH-quinone reductase subunit A [Myxococcales bacterium]|nr:Na(+)-translocating NADH-quinone reductase subunit A [Myxococcales bacterium]